MKRKWRFDKNIRWISDRPTIVLIQSEHTKIYYIGCVRTDRADAFILKAKLPPPPSALFTFQWIVIRSAIYSEWLTRRHPLCKLIFGPKLVKGHTNSVYAFSLFAAHITYIIQYQVCVCVRCCKCDLHLHTGAGALFVGYVYLLMCNVDINIWGNLSSSPYRFTPVVTYR